MKFHRFSRGGTHLRAQGAIESSDASLGIELRSMSDAFCQSKMHINCRHLAGQGATEYLVLLAVVLIVALVSVALLGFFPGMASDAQVTQSKAYWSGASPIAISEWSARTSMCGGCGAPPKLYLHLRNVGAYPIRITKIIGADGTGITQFFGYAGNCGVSSTGYQNISDYLHLSPGEEKYFGDAGTFGTACTWQITATTASSSSNSIGGASAVCQETAKTPDTLNFKTFGFEYIAYIDGQQITKRQIGKDFIVKCLLPV